MNRAGSSLEVLMSRFSQPGKVISLFIRPERKTLPNQVSSVLAIEDQGLEGDHYKSAGGNRQVTLIQEEHLKAAASFLNRQAIDPKLVRRNIVVSGINLLALKDKFFSIGEVELQCTGECHPCSRMEENLGEGGYNAMRGHGGITAKIIKGGTIRVSDKVVAVPTVSAPEK